MLDRLIHIYLSIVTFINITMAYNSNFVICFFLPLIENKQQKHKNDNYLKPKFLSLGQNMSYEVQLTVLLYVLKKIQISRDFSRYL